MSLTDQINDQVAEWTDDEVMFTAYDVTTALRNAGSRINHNAVRAEVHKLYNDNDFNPAYDKTNVKIPGTINSAFLFHHTSSDVDEYEPVKSTYQPNTPKKASNQWSCAPTPKPSLSVRPTARNKQPTNGVLDPAYPKGDGRLMIPAVLLRDAGLKGSKIAVVQDGNKVVLTSPSDASADYPTQTTEDKSPGFSDTICLPARLLKSLNKSVYTISLASNGKEVHVE